MKVYRKIRQIKQYRQVEIIYKYIRGLIAMTIVVKPERCLNKRFAKAKCQVCTEACPAEAISKNQEINDSCSNCGLCLAKCPVEAIAGGSYPDKAIQQLIDKEQSISLICQKAQPDSPWPCLGFLDPILLLAFVFSNKGNNRELIIYYKDCRNCNAAIAKHIALTIEEANRLLDPDKSRITSSVAKFNGAIAAGSSRRQFLAELLGASLSTVRNIAFPDLADIEPIQRRDIFLLHNGARLLPSHVCDQITFKTLVIGDTCNACGICEKMCCQGAISTVAQETGLEIKHNPVLCRNCGICVSQCPQGAISIIPAISLAEGVVQRVEIPVCQDCGKIFRPIGSTKVCLNCMQKAKIISF